MSKACFHISVGDYQDTNCVAYIRVCPGKVAKTVHVTDRIIADYNEDGSLHGVEFHAPAEVDVPERIEIGYQEPLTLTDPDEVS